MGYHKPLMRASRHPSVVRARSATRAGATGPQRVSTTHRVAALEPVRVRSASFRRTRVASRATLAAEVSSSSPPLPTRTMHAATATRVAPAAVATTAARPPARAVALVARRPLPARPRLRLDRASRVVRPAFDRGASLSSAETSESDERETPAEIVVEPLDPVESDPSTPGCGVNEDGDEVCELTFAPPPDADDDAPTARARALMAGAHPTDDAVIASQLDRFEPEPTTAELWWRAAKLPMYSVALAPLAAAAAMCHHWYGCVNAPQLGCLAAGACLVIAWLNLSNDAWDAATGVDSNRAGGKPESVVRLLGGDSAAATKTHVAAAACLLAGAASLCKAVAVTFTAGADPAVIATSGAMLAAATALGHAYQGPPFRLSYKGLGEPLCFAAFGPLATGAFYLALASGVPGGSVWGGLPAAPSLAQPGVMGVAALVGLTTTAILFASHLHQEEGDRAAGKMSPVVRMGARNAVEALRYGLAGHHVLALGLALGGMLPVMGCVGVWLAAPLAAMTASFAKERVETPAALFKTKYLAVRWHVVHAALLAAGCWLDPWMPWHLAAGRVPGLAIGVVY